MTATMMLTKSLILVLLSGAFVLAKPLTEENTSEEDFTIEGFSGVEFLQWFKDGKYTRADVWETRKNQGASALEKLLKETDSPAGLDEATRHRLTSQADALIDENARSVREVLDLWSRKIEEAVKHDVKESTPDGRPTMTQQVRIAAEFELYKELFKADARWNGWEKEVVAALK